MGQPPEHRMVISSRTSQIPRALEAVLARVKAVGYDENSRFAVRLALEEALSNAIHHGNLNDPDQPVEIRCQVGPRRVRIEVIDQGLGFDPGRVPDPTLDENLTRPCGRGVMLIKAYMDQVTFNRRGNRLTMVRRRDSRLPR